ncbi:MAG: cobalamin-binding protein [Gammaproteobacteria bacterium]|nr:cobalamin-binding protein [Gammaproteobacteria bacterium]MDH5593549.1 cobalamin-binding protein [Gammaproteobacteria bacterium]MDH5613662.1 cobalamin-binding protein [Gammaproteobacteria bacterium]
MTLIYRLSIVFLVCYSFSVNAGQVARIIIEDDNKQTLTFAKPVSRIVSLAPHITELLFTAGAGDRIVGVVEHSDYPEAAKQLPIVGSGFGLDLEKIAALKPDLVVAWHGGNPEKQIEKLKTMGFPVFESDPKDIDGITKNLVRFSQLAGTEVVANQFVKKFHKRHRKLKNDYAKRNRVTVFYQIWHDPLMTVGSNHLINYVLELCAGKNVFDELDKPAVKISLESVVQRDPEVIITSRTESESEFNALAHWEKWKEMQAVQGNNLFLVSPSILQRHGPRILDGADEVCNYLDKVRDKKRESATSVE